MRLRLSVLALLLTATSACAEPARDAVEVSVAPTEVGVSPVQEGSEGAEAFVRAVYASYSEDENATPPMVRGQDSVWSDRMNALIRRDQELATEDLPYLDADPICNCQDWENLSVRSIRIDREPGVAGRRATVRFIKAGQETTTVLRLTGGPGNWRIDDVLNEGDHPSLAAALAESNRRIEAGGNAYGRD